MRNMDLHLNEIESDSDIPFRPWLIGPLVKRLIPRPAHIDLVPSIIRIRGIVVRINIRPLVRLRASFLRPQHQYRRGNPQQKHQHLGRQSDYRPCDRTAREGIPIQVVRDEIVQGESESEDGCYDADGEGAVDGGPPAAMNAGVADENQETGGDEELGDSGEVEDSGIREDGHGGGEV